MKQPIAENDAVNVGSGAFVQAQGNLNLIAGGDMNGDLNDLTTGSNAYELNASAVPAFELVSKCEVDQTNTVNVGSGAMLLAAGNANLMAEQNGNAVTNAFGTGKDWLTAVAGGVASLFGGSGVSSDVHTGTGIVNTTTTVTVNGTIQLGIDNIQSLTIQKDILANPTDYTVSGPISFTQDTENLVNDLTTELTNLENLVVAYAGDIGRRRAPMTSEIQQVEFELAQLGLAYTADRRNRRLRRCDRRRAIHQTRSHLRRGRHHLRERRQPGGRRQPDRAGQREHHHHQQQPCLPERRPDHDPAKLRRHRLLRREYCHEQLGASEDVNQNQTAPSFTIQVANTSVAPTITITNTYSASDPANAGFEGDNFTTPGY